MRRRRMGSSTELQEVARTLRRHTTPAEDVLWEALRRRPFGLKFRRQHAFETFVFDFYCSAKKLAIEVDGGIHDDEGQRGRDGARDAICAQHGVQVRSDAASAAGRHLSRGRGGEAPTERVLRVSNAAVLADVDGVVGAIGAAADAQNEAPLQGLITAPRISTDSA